jgi:transposase
MFTLTATDRAVVQDLTRTGTTARVINRAHILNMRDKGLSAMEVADFLEFTPRTVINVTTRYEQDGLKRALYDDPRPGRPPEFDAGVEAYVVATVCSDPPQGFDRWTLELLREHVQQAGVVESISTEKLRLILKEHDLKPWQQKMWCVPELTAQYIERMEAILGVYARAYDADNPVVCLDEKPVVLHSDKREALMMEPGDVKKVDYEYQREGTANVFSVVEPKAGRYLMRVTENKKGPAFAKLLGEIERKYADASMITLVMDNYTTHTKKSVIDFYGEEQGQRLWDRFAIYRTPVHASWLNQAEIAIGMYARQCLGQARVPDIDTLRKRTAAWCKIINRKKITIEWKFDVQKAREKFAYA